MIRCIIIDDEAPARAIIKTFLQEIDTIEVVAECTNGFDGFKSIDELKPDLIFLDVQMPKLTGFEMLEILEKKPAIIFTTAYDQYALKAFEHNASDYLLKPFSKDRFFEAVAKVEKRILEEEAPQIESLIEEVRDNGEILDRIVVKSGTKISIVPIDTIMYVKAEDDYVMLHTTNGRFLKQMTMKFLDQNLPGESFARIHRSYILNLSFIDKMERYEKETFMLILKNGDKLKSSKSGAKILKEKLKF